MQCGESWQPVCVREFIKLKWLPMCKVSRWTDENPCPSVIFSSLHCRSFRPLKSASLRRHSHASKSGHARASVAPTKTAAGKHRHAVICELLRAPEPSTRDPDRSQNLFLFLLFFFLLFLLLPLSLFTSSFGNKIFFFLCRHSTRNNSSPKRTTTWDTSLLYTSHCTISKSFSTMCTGFLEDALFFFSEIEELPFSTHRRCKQLLQSELQRRCRGDRVGDLCELPLSTNTCTVFSLFYVMRVHMHLFVSFVVVDPEFWFISISCAISMHVRSRSIIRMLRVWSCDVVGLWSRSEPLQSEVVVYSHEEVSAWLILFFTKLECRCRIAVGSNLGADSSKSGFGRNLQILNELRI